MKTEIFLIRHAEPIKDFQKFFNNIDKQLCNEKTILSVKGEEQAKNLANLSELSNLDAVISSSYVRAISTAKYLVNKNNCPFYIDDCFNERKIGSDNTNKEFWLKQMLDKNIKLSDGESQIEVRSRMLKGINDVLKTYSGKKIAIVSHAAAITFLLMNWCNLDDVKLEGKIRKLVFNNKVVINDSFKTPDIFKLTFINNKINNIERINI